MTDQNPDDATVLVVDDETSLADLYAHWFESEGYDVRAAYGGKQALEEVDDAVDVVLLDRRMPDMSGDEVLERIRQRSYDVRVAMVTAVDPDFDIIDMEFDDYLVKSVTKDEILDTVEYLLALTTYDEKRTRLSSMKVRRNVLEVEKRERELDDSEAFERLEREIEGLEEDLGELTEELDVGDADAIEKRL